MSGCEDSPVWRLPVTWLLLTSLSHTHTGLCPEEAVVDQSQQLPAPNTNTTIRCPADTLYNPTTDVCSFFQTPVSIDIMSLCPHWAQLSVFGTVASCCLEDPSSSAPSTASVFVRDTSLVFKLHFSSKASQSLKDLRPLYSVYVCLDVADTVLVSDRYPMQTSPSTLHITRVHTDYNKFIIFPPKDNSLYLLGNK